MPYSTRKLDKNAVSIRFDFADISCIKGNFPNNKFFNPRRGHSNEEVFANEVFKENGYSIRAVNLYDKNGQFCCSYIDHDISRIFEANKLDCQRRDIEEKKDKEANIQNDKNGYSKIFEYGANKIDLPYRPTQEESWQSTQRLEKEKQATNDLEEKFGETNESNYNYDNFIGH